MVIRPCNHVSLSPCLLIKIKTLMKNLALILASCTLLLACSQPKPEPAAPEPKPQLFEVGDSKYTDIAKQTLYSLRDGNMDAYITNFSDNAKFNWNYLDSIQGKQTIYDYWKKRRDNVIDTLIF